VGACCVVMNVQLGPAAGVSSAVKVACRPTQQSSLSCSAYASVCLYDVCMSQGGGVLMVPWQEHTYLSAACLDRRWSDEEEVWAE
jgi:hypothetical protein